MEDLFQIIIIVIFILSSIVSSMNKKKKQQRKNKETKIPTQRDAQTTMQKKKQKTSAEILEEMLGFKIELPEPPKKEAPKSYSEDLERSGETWDPANDFRDYSGESIQSKSSENVYKPIQAADYEDKYRSFKKNVEPVETKSEPTKIQKIFADQSNLKNYILIQEILNKPKALRR